MKIKKEKKFRIIKKGDGSFTPEMYVIDYYGKGSWRSCRLPDKYIGIRFATLAEAENYVILVSNCSNTPIKNSDVVVLEYEK